MKVSYLVKSKINLGGAFKTFKSRDKEERHFFLQLNWAKPKLVAQILSRLGLSITEDISVGHSKEIATLGGDNLTILSTGILLGVDIWESS